MDKTVISTTKAPSAIGPYSQGIRVGNMVYTSGQLGINPETGELPEDLGTQAHQVFKNLKAVLEEAGTSLDNVVKTLVFLADMNDFVAVNNIYQEYFTGTYPARSAVQVARLPKDAKLEVEAIAIVK